MKTKLIIFQSITRTFIEAEMKNILKASFLFRAQTDGWEWAVCASFLIASTTSRLQPLVAKPFTKQLKESTCTASFPMSGKRFTRIVKGWGMLHPTTHDPPLPRIPPPIPSGEGKSKSIYASESVAENYNIRKNHICLFCKDFQIHYL